MGGIGSYWSTDFPDAMAYGDQELLLHLHLHGYTPPSIMTSVALLYFDRFAFFL